MRIGIDIGGSHFAVGLIDENGVVVKIEERYTKDKESLSSEEFMVQGIAEIINSWISEEGISVSKIGIGVPGVVKNKSIISCINMGITNFNIKEALQELFPYASIAVANDAKCAAAAEKKWGSLQPYDDCIFLCFGTGVGGATFYNGKMVIPKRCSGSEFGHMIIEKNGRPCKCGSYGCFEQYGSMKVFKQTIKERLGIDESIEGSELRDFIRNHIEDEIVKATIDEFASYVSTGLTNLVNILEPSAICLGGGFVKYEDILLDAIKEKFTNSNELFYKEHKPEIVLAKFGNDAGLIGSTLNFD